MMRMALIGCRAVDAIATAIDGIDDARVVAVVDPDAEDAERAARIMGATGQHETLERLLDERGEDIDAVLLIDPDAVTVSSVDMAAAAGKHILVDMPLALTAAETQECDERCRAADVTLCLGISSRHLPAHKQVREALHAGRLGTPGLVRVHSWGHERVEAESPASDAAGNRRSSLQLWRLPRDGVRPWRQAGDGRLLAASPRVRRRRHGAHRLHESAATRTGLQVAHADRLRRSSVRRRPPQHAAFTAWRTRLRTPDDSRHAAPQGARVRVCRCRSGTLRPIAQLEGRVRLDRGP